MSELSWGEATLLAWAEQEIARRNAVGKGSDGIAAAVNASSAEDERLRDRAIEQLQFLARVADEVRRRDEGGVPADPNGLAAELFHVEAELAELIAQAPYDAGPQGRMRDLELRQAELTSAIVQPTPDSPLHPGRAPDRNPGADALDSGVTGPRASATKFLIQATQDAVWAALRIELTPDKSKVNGLQGMLTGFQSGDPIARDLASAQLRFIRETHRDSERIAEAETRELEPNIRRVFDDFAGHHREIRKPVADALTRGVNPWLDSEAVRFGQLPARLLTPELSKLFAEIDQRLEALADNRLKQSGLIPDPDNVGPDDDLAEWTAAYRERIRVDGGNVSGMPQLEADLRSPDQTVRDAAREKLLFIQAVDSDAQRVERIRKNQVSPYDQPAVEHFMWHYHEYREALAEAYVAGDLDKIEMFEAIRDAHIAADAGQETGHLWARVGLLTSEHQRRGSTATPKSGRRIPPPGGSGPRALETEFTSRLAPSKTRAA